jgi:hypothetical protein
MIEPTIGRVVWYHPPSDSAIAGFKPAPVCAALVAAVGEGGHVNLAAFDAEGKHHSRRNVPLIQDEQSPPDTGDWCEWMPYQKGQAAKTEALEAAATAQTAAPTTTT